MLKFDVVYKYTKYLFFDCVELSAAMGDFFVSTLYACHIFFLSLFLHTASEQNIFYGALLSENMTRKKCFKCIRSVT